MCRSLLLSRVYSSRVRVRVRALALVRCRGPLPAAAFSVLMLLATKGKQYSLSELRSILEDAGFTDVEAMTTGGGYYSLVSARKP